MVGNVKGTVVELEHNLGPRDQLDIQRQLLGQVYEANPRSAVGIACISFIIVLSQWESIDQAILLTWFIAQLCVCIWRLLQHRQFVRHDIKDLDVSYWRDRMYFTVVLSAIGWGATALFLVPIELDIHESIIATILLGIAGAAVTTLASMPKALTAFVVISVGPLIVRLLMLETLTADLLAVMCGVLIYMFCSGASRFHDTIISAIEMRNSQERVKGLMTYQASHDELTGLPNRRLLRERLISELNRSGRQKKYSAVLFFDLDRFKVVNDSLGHQIGDKLLQHVSKKLQNNVRSEDTVARLSGDEFVALVVDLGDDLEAAARSASLTAENIRKALGLPAEIDGHNLTTRTSIGIALFSGKEDSPDVLLKQADSAMYQAKSEGRDTVCFFQASMQEAADRELRLEKELRYAIENHELEFHYQVIEHCDGMLLGAEALLRWPHSEEGMIMPDVFIPIAEESGLIHQLGNEVLRLACQGLKILLAEKGCDENFILSINVSPKEFSHSNFATDFMEIVSSSGINPKNIQVELTENVLLMDIDDARAKINEIKTLGVRFAIDDFGTGQSSLAYIKHLPVDTLKIDRCFVKDIRTDIVDETIVETTVSMAKRLGLNIVAEGVEDEATLQILRSMGCTYVQGYYLGKPEPIEDFIQRLN